MLRVKAITIDGTPVTMHISIVGDREVHRGIIAHSPLLSKLSSGKLHLLMLAENLLSEG